MSCPRHNAGFSLIEVMVAILILGIALVGLTRGVTTALGSSKESELQTAAALLASGQIETTRASKEILDGETSGSSSDMPRYHWTQTISAGSIDGLHEVRVSVFDTNGTVPIYQLSTMLFDADYPGQDEGAGKTDHRKPAKHRKGRGAE